MNGTGEPEGDDDWLVVCDDLGTQVDDIDLPRILHLPRERHRHTIDGELAEAAPRRDGVLPADT